MTFQPYLNILEYIGILPIQELFVMSKTVTLRLDDKSYELIKQHAQADNRPLSNFIETATLKYIEEIDYVDDYEMAQILNDKDLLNSLKRGSSDAAKKKGKFV